MDFGDPLDRLDQPVVIVLLVDLHAIDVVGEKIPCRQSDQSGSRKGNLDSFGSVFASISSHFCKSVQIPVKKLSAFSGQPSG